MFTSELTPNDMDIEFDVKLLSTVYPDSTSVSLESAWRACGEVVESISVYIMNSFITDRICWQLILVARGSVYRGRPINYGAAVALDSSVIFRA